MCVWHSCVHTRDRRTAPIEREEDIQHDDHAVEEWCRHQPRATCHVLSQNYLDFLSVTWRGYNLLS